MGKGTNLASCVICERPYMIDIELDDGTCGPKCSKDKFIYEMSKDESYSDWHDNGPGSENFKRELRTPEMQTNSILKMVYGIDVNVIDDRPGKSGKILKEQIDAVNKYLKANVKLSPLILMPKGLLEEVVKSSYRLFRYVEKLEKELRQ